MNQTMLAVKEVLDQYYWIGDKCFDKNIVHISIGLIVIGLILIGYYLRKNWSMEDEQ